MNARYQTYAGSLIYSMRQQKSERAILINQIISEKENAIFGVILSLADRANRLSPHTVSVSAENSDDPIQTLAIWWINSYSQNDTIMLNTIWPLIRDNNETFEFIDKLAYVVHKMQEAKKR